MFSYHLLIYYPFSLYTPVASPSTHFVFDFMLAGFVRFFIALNVFVKMYARLVNIIYVASVYRISPSKSFVFFFSSIKYDFIYEIISGDLKNTKLYAGIMFESFYSGISRAHNYAAFYKFESWRIMTSVRFLYEFRK